jgi:hypothetical protein
VIGGAFLVLGVALMLAWYAKAPEFFRRKPEVADPTVLSAREP